MGMVDGDHGGMIGQTEDEAAVHEPGWVDGHLGDAEEFHSAETRLDLNGAAAKPRIDLLVGQDLHDGSPCEAMTRIALHTRKADRFQLAMPIYFR
jgi:hypothetical protein